MEIKDYLHFYIGQRCVTPFGVMVLSYFNPKSRYKAWFTDDYEENRGHLYENNVTGHAFFMTEFKPILRKLSDMTEEELKQTVASEWGTTHTFTEHYCKKKIAEISKSSHGLFSFLGMYGTNQSLPYLLKQGFDLFGLIDSGLAIDNKSI